MKGKVIAIGIGAFAVGAVGGYIFGYKTTVKKLEDWANDEISKVRTMYQQKLDERVIVGDPALKTGVFATPEGAAEFLIAKDEDPDQKALREVGRDKVNQMFVDGGYAPLSGFEEPPLRDKVEVVESLATTGPPTEEPNPLEGLTGAMIEESIWGNTARTGEIATVIDAPEEEDEGDLRVEFIPKRHPDRPYVIPESWYMGEDEYAKLDVVYFEEDGVLMGEGDQVITAKEETVGEQNLHKFGIGTNDRNSVYIRNEKLQTDYEVIRDKRSYMEAVHNMKAPGEDTGPHKLRNDDE